MDKAMNFAVALLVVEIVGGLIALSLIGVKLFASKETNRYVNHLIERFLPDWKHS